MNFLMNSISKVRLARSCAGISRSRDASKHFLQNQVCLRAFLSVVLLLAFCGKISAVESEIICRQSQALLAPGDSPADARKYAPSREIDILHLALDVTPDFKERN